MISLDSKSSVSIHDQIVTKITQLIVVGALKEDEKLPSIRSLSKQLVINPNTVHKAYQTLEEKGYLTSGEKKGYFVKTLNNNLKQEEINKNYTNLLQTAKTLIQSGETKEKIISKINNFELGE